MDNMDNQVSEARCSVPSNPRSVGGTLAAETPAQQRKKELEGGVSYLDSSAPERLVILSDKLEYLAHQVGGCQTDALLALLRRVMYELMVRAKR